MRKTTWYKKEKNIVHQNDIPTSGVFKSLDWKLSLQSYSPDLSPSG